MYPIKITVLFSLFYTLLYCNNPGEIPQKKTGANPADPSFVVVPEKISDFEPGKHNKVGDIPLPEGYERISADSGSIGWYLRNLPLRQNNNIVYLYNGSQKYRQDVHYAIVDLDVGTQDLQQCADAAMRIRAQFLYETKQYDKIHFNFLSDGKPRYYTDYAGTDRSWKKFRKYLNYIYSYANTKSLYGETISVEKMEDIIPGYVFIQTGNPYGHAVTVMDVAVNKVSGEKIFLLSQSYMPAQDIHILKNPSNKDLSPWYKAGFSGDLLTPEWVFTDKDLRKFRD